MTISLSIFFTLDSDDHIVLAFKPTVPSDQNENQQQQKQQSSSGTLISDEYQFARAWGSFGHDDGQFDAPWDIAIDLSGNVYIAEKDNSRIQKFDSNGNFITKWESKDNGQFYYLRGIAVDLSGNVYVADSGNARIQVFAPSSSTSVSN